MTTASFTASGTRIYRQVDRLAGKSVMRTLFERFVAGRQLEAERLVASVHADRWCDATERRLISGITDRPDRL